MLKSAACMGLYAPDGVLCTRRFGWTSRVLITGGAGFLGINLTRHLLSRGYAVASLDVEQFDYPERDRVEIIKGDIRNKALVDRALEGADFVVHTAAACRSTRLRISTPPMWRAPATSSMPLCATA